VTSFRDFETKRTKFITTFTLTACGRRSQISAKRNNHSGKEDPIEVEREWEEERKKDKKSLVHS
jgi:hypothetical protein